MGAKNEQEKRVSVYISCTDKTLQSIKNDEEKWPDRSTVFWFKDNTGYGVRVGKGGTISFVYRYKVKGKKQVYPIGKYPVVSLAEANKKYGDLAHQVSKEGRDPLAELRDKELHHDSSPTIMEFVDTYIEKHCKGVDFINGKSSSPFKKGWAAEERILKSEFGIKCDGDTEIVEKRKAIKRRNGLLNKKIVDVARRDLTTMINVVVDRGSGVMANRLLSSLKAMFNFAVARGVLEESPCANIKKPVKEKPVKRKLADDEIKELWASLDDAKGKFSQNRNNIFKMLLLMGQRLSETRLMEWNEIQGTQWHIPSAKTKTGDEQILVFPKLALEVLVWQRAFTGGQKYVFSGKRKSRNHQYGETCFERSACSRSFKKLITVFEWEEMATPHDLRRTLRSGLSKLNVNPVTCEKVLNHRLPGLFSTYDVHLYIDEKAIALQKWSDCLEGIIYPESKQSNVIPLKKAAS